MYESWNLAGLRIAIRNQEISFPSQVPAFEHLRRNDIQWRMVVLYFVRGWSGQAIAARYQITPKRVWQLLRQWTAQAIVLGYVDRIPSEEECALPVVARCEPQRSRELYGRLDDRLIAEILQEDKTSLNVAKLCRIYQISQATLHYWRKRYPRHC